VSQAGEIARLEYETGPLDRYTVSRQEGEIVALKKAVPIHSDVVEVGCAIKSSIYESFKRCGENASLASRFVDILAWDVDFFQDVRKGDEFKLVVEKKTLSDGSFVGYGNILAAEYTGKFGMQRLFWFEDPDGDGSGYYKEDGKSARKEFIKTPLKFTRISSGYTHNRFHPVLHSYKKHLAIDYAAPVGTPVWAVAAGTVEYAAPKGPSGNLVAIRHANGYVSYYAHLHKFAPGIKVGARVDQKTTIGAVGTTGRSTGPHLHFALKHKGRFVNPQTIKYTTANPVPIEHLEEFKDMVEKHLERLERIKVIGVDEKKA
jgi:murein DD-endopeptidase MepM/ murein hydrolase activator NlpD